MLSRKGIHNHNKGCGGRGGIISCRGSFITDIGDTIQLTNFPTLFIAWNIDNRRPTTNARAIKTPEQ